MFAQNPPEVFDGGYWYVVKAMVDADQGRAPGDIPGSGWCAWYKTIGRVDYVAVRTPEAVAGINSATDVTVGQIVSDFGIKPFGRVRGG